MQMAAAGPQRRDHAHLIGGAAVLRAVRFGRSEA